MNRALVGAIVMVSLSGCGDLDAAAVRPTAEAPSAVRVDAIHVPYDSSLPKYVVAVEPVSFRSPQHEQFGSRTVLSEGAEQGLSDMSRRVDRGTSYDETTRASGVLGTNGSRSPADPAGQGGAQNRSPRGVPGVTSVNATASRHAAGPVAGIQGQVNQAIVRRDTELSSAQAKGRETRTGKTTTSYYHADRTLNHDPRAEQISAQFVSALSAVENFSVRDYRTVRRSANGLYDSAIRPGETGPFIVRAQITEYGTKVESDRTKTRFFPFGKTSAGREVGVVTLDVSIIDGRTGGIVRSFPVTGTFRSQEKEVQASLVFPIYEREQSARSLVDQAMRVALNDAAEKVFHALQGAAR